jgi:energy-converting hydrogenase A subunit O
MYLLNLRERILDQQERISGARVNKAYMIPGGVRFDLQADDRAALLREIPRIEAEGVRFAQMFATGPLIGLRSHGIGVLTREAAIEAHAVGPTARACGIAEDCRSRHPTYTALGFSPITRTEGDNFARIMLRFQEIGQSLALVRTCLDHLPEGPIRGGGICGAGAADWSGEAPRGELFYYLRTDEFGRITEVAIRTPSIMNIEACAHAMLPGVPSLADVTSTFVSADPCIACDER